MRAINEVLLINMADKIIDYEMNDVKMKLKIGDNVFAPTSTSKFLVKSAEIERGCRILDLGCGVGPISIYYLKKGAGEVYAVDIMEEACEYAKYNAKLNEVSDKMHILNGDLFGPLGAMKFDVIVDDVSGMAEEVSRFSPWYPVSIPTGGKDGTEPTIRMLKNVGNYLERGGRLYFPVLSLAKSKKILQKAEEIFGNGLEKIMSKRIPFCDELKNKIQELERMKKEGLLDFFQSGSRYFWTLEIFKGSY